MNLHRHEPIAAKYTDVQGIANGFQTRCCLFPLGQLGHCDISGVETGPESVGNVREHLLQLQGALGGL